MTKYDCCVIGAGSLGTSIANLLHTDHQVIATHHDPQRLEDLDTATTTDNAYASHNSQTTILTVRPDQIQKAVNETEDWTTLLNLTPHRIEEDHVIQAACTPPLNDQIHYFGYDDQAGHQEDTNRVKQLFRPHVRTLEPTQDHTQDLADMAQVYAHLLTYLDDTSISSPKLNAYLSLVSDTVRTTPKISEVLAKAATKGGFTAATLQHADAIKRLQRKEHKSMEDIHHDTRP